MIPISTIGKDISIFSSKKQALSVQGIPGKNLDKEAKLCFATLALTEF